MKAQDLCGKFIFLVGTYEKPKSLERATEMIRRRFYGRLALTGRFEPKLYNVMS